MPLYEYKCDSCGDVFEVIQKFSDEPLDVHEGCGGHVERLLSAPVLQFKGTGWYVTDYARGSGDRNGKTSKDPSPASSNKNGKSEASSASSAPKDSTNKK